ncbi:hypothetical protein FHG64_08015 [Antarcticibacterium flavum]|uniref:Uncharacterized protein n=1 Tax=Antarcticibacterium flavum TaxID=2058175 RepID=A0A5B7X3P2_9FLAO|nr:hypothetical protein [Antarcticibacterium flavum]QCY69342.1 hypothetical protein FHG64_08015 [Antarcticibacterium flavum]
MQTISKFIKNPNYDLTFTVGECDRTENMCTNWENVDTTGEVFIKIEDTNQNPINFAAGFLHEGIHAEIFRFVNEHHTGDVDPDDMPLLFEYFQLYAGTAYADNIDHIYMTIFYIKPIAEALWEMDNLQYPLNYYKTFAWDGLRNYDPNNSLGITDEEYSQYRNEITSNFNIKCDEQ